MIRYVGEEDFEIIKIYDRHISEAELEKAVYEKRVLVQFFYRKNGYVDCGSLLLPGEPLEIILRKELI